MKVNKKSTKIAYWVLRALAISFALLLFSVTGIVGTQTATHATAIAGVLDTATSEITSLPTLTITLVPPTATPTPTLPTPTPPPTPTTTTQLPTATPIPTTKPTAIVNTPTPVVVPTNTPIINAGAPFPTPVATGTPKATPNPTPSLSPTASPTGTQVPTTPSQNTSTPSNTQPDSGGMTSMVGPIVGVGSALLLAAVGAVGMMFWRKRTAGQGAVPQLQASPAPWMHQQTAVPNNYYAQATAATVAQQQNILPFAMQGIAQYSPLLGAPDTSHLDAPVPPPASDLRPLSIDYPQLLEVHTDKTAVPMSASLLQSFSPAKNADFQPALQLAANPFPPLPDSLDAHAPSTPARMPIPSAQSKPPVAFQFPPHDSLLENLMHQAQTGIFSLPNKKG